MKISTAQTLALALALVVGCTATARADAESNARWGISIWGLSYHVNRSIDYDEANLGAGLRYYFNSHVFVEGDVLRNSNRGVVLPVSGGVEFKVASFGGACGVYAVGALTLAYYQNPRTATEYFKFGPVPGVTIGCGRVKTNLLAILSPSGQPLAAIVASVTILF